MRCISCCGETEIDYHFCKSCVSKRKKAKSSLFSGSVLITAGVVITALSYSISVTENREKFYIFYGIIGIGLITFFLGLSEFLRFRKLDKNPEKYAPKDNIYDGEVNEDVLKRYLENRKKDG